MAANFAAIQIIIEYIRIKRSKGYEYQSQNRKTGGGNLLSLQNKRLQGFTLAEVLITLGIIGVVAAMTIPILMTKCTNIVVETRLKSFYSKINQAIRLSEYDNEEKEGWTAADTNEFWEKYLRNYLKYMRYENKRVGNSNDWRLVYLIDGSAFLMDIYGTWDEDGNQKTKTNGSHFIFCPSAKYCEGGSDKTKWGRAQFVFGYWPAGEIMPKYHKNKGVEPYLNGWNGKRETLYVGSSYSCNEKNNNFYCTAIIQQNGWKIPSNYPYKVRL